MSHTSGPWLVTDTRISGRLAIGWAEGTVAYVALPDSDDTELADASLIAAAPELLEAAERALNFIANTENEIGDTLESGDLLRAAIAKARGAA